MSHFFAFMSRMKFIKRWGLMHSNYPENIQEHSVRVAMIAHALAVIRNRCFEGQVNPERTATLALYHDVSEVLTGDLPTPIKYFNPSMRSAYKELEANARSSLLELVPNELRGDYKSLLEGSDSDTVHHQLIRGADKLCAYIKCLEEARAGNQEFKQAERALEKTLHEMDLPEVGYFLTTFLPSFSLTLDELQQGE
jgi:5'-deoxynucleotidase|tara:strand:- start:99 stop:686 length:588 start_codon:yes stop_codon:yes gene_type:complete